VRAFTERLDVAIQEGTAKEAFKDIAAEVSRHLCDKEREPCFREPSHLPPVDERRDFDTLLCGLRDGSLLDTNEDSRGARRRQA
jgi:hypothetical protein